MRDSTKPCDPYLTGSTCLATPTELTPPSLQLLAESTPPVLQIHARETPPGLAIRTELIAQTVQHQLD